MQVHVFVKVITACIKQTAASILFNPQLSERHVIIINIHYTTHILLSHLWEVRFTNGKSARLTHSGKLFEVSSAQTVRI